MIRAVPKTNHNEEPRFFLGRRQLPTDFEKIIINFLESKTLHTLQIVNARLWNRISSQVHCLAVKSSFTASKVPLSLVRSMTHLKKLELTFCFINDEGWRPLSQLTTLQSLSLQKCEANADLLSNLVSLHTLNLESSSIYNLSALSHLTALQSLSLAYCSCVTDESLQHLSGLTHLTHLDLRACYQITERSLEIFSSLISLQRLNLSGCFAITNVGVLSKVAIL